MSDLKVGRNDLCPCGSGKKYKKCCAVLEEFSFSDDPFIRYSQILTEVKVKLDQYYGQQIRKVRKDLQTRFVRFTVNKSIPREHESIFSDWLWFDQTDEEGETLGCNYLKENGNFMHPIMLEYLHALNFSCLSVYEVKGYEDQFLNIEDIFTSQHYKVLLKEPWPAENENPVLILGRLLCTAEASIFSGMVLICDNQAGQKEFIREHIEYLSSICGEKTNRRLKFNGDILYGVFDHAFHKMTLSLDNIEAARLNESEAAVILDKLTGSGDYSLVHESAGVKWFQPAAYSFGYVRIAVGDEHLLSCAEALEDVLKIREFIASAWPPIEFKVINSRLMTFAPPIENKLWFMVLKDKECERWLDTAHSELDGKTPREILAQEDGRQKLLQVLNDFQESLAGENEKELIEYMKNRITG